MKELKLFFDMEFTSLSPDAQPISLGIVSGKTTHEKTKYPVGVVGWDYISAKNLADYKGLQPDGSYAPFKFEHNEYVLLFKPEHFIGRKFSGLCVPKQIIDKVPGYELSYEMQSMIESAEIVKSDADNSKSFYAEFTDFDINRCDDWVKENVVGKLWRNNTDLWKQPLSDKDYVGDTYQIIPALREWLSQFSDYQIQFVCDCGTWDWYWLVQLLDERISSKGVLIIDRNTIKDEDIETLINEFKRQPTVIFRESEVRATSYFQFKTGLPKLPSNISPVPLDLNDLIAFKKGISVKEAFDLDREELAFPDNNHVVLQDGAGLGGIDMPMNKHNSLWDVKVIKAIYENLL